MVPNTSTHKNCTLFANIVVKAWLTQKKKKKKKKKKKRNISKQWLHCSKRAKWLPHLNQVNQTDPERFVWNRTKGWKGGFLCVNDEKSKRNICSYCIWKTYSLGHKNAGRSTIGCTRPQNNMFEKQKTNPSTQHTLQQSNTTYCISFTTWTAHKWCLPSHTMISIPSIIWRPRGTIKRLARKMHTRKYRALYKD